MTMDELTRAAEEGVVASARTEQTESTTERSTLETFRSSSGDVVATIKSLGRDIGRKVAFAGAEVMELTRRPESPSQGTAVEAGSPVPSAKRLFKVAKKAGSRLKKAMAKTTAYVKFSRRTSQRPSHGDDN